ncbi:MAG: HEAT repeat domain-containing protein [Spirochaetes bacterium]|nr:HEAT repeat domain-containing protein [Spirochaetota bacterium]
MQNPKKDRSLNKNTAKKNFLACLFSVLFFLYYANIIQAQPDAEKAQQLLDLQKKINELNASLAKANTKDKTEDTKLIEQMQNQENNENNEPADKNTNLNKNIINDNKINVKNNESGERTNSKDNKESDAIRKNEPSSNEEKAKDNVKQEKTPGDKKEDEEYKKDKRRADYIKNTIDNGTHKDRRDAINLILKIKNSELRKELETKIINVISNEIDLDVRVKAITVAGELKSNNAVPELVKCLDSESKDVVVAAIYAIKSIGDLTPKPVLIKKFKEQKLENNSNETEALIDALGEFKAVELIEYAGNALKDIKTNEVIRELLVLFLGKLESKDAKNILVEILKDEDEGVQIRAFAANSLANLGVKEAADDIEKVISTIEKYPFNKKKKYYNLYIYSVAALSKMGDEKAIPRLINALRSDNAVVRLKAVSLIKELKDKRTIDILKYKRDYDPSPKVQKAAKDALKELGVESEDKNEDSKSSKESSETLENESTDNEF